jgi:hypothetical protein
MKTRPAVIELFYVCGHGNGRGELNRRSAEVAKGSKSAIYTPETSMRAKVDFLAEEQKLGTILIGGLSRSVYPT